jgi:hypothetical protein
MLQALPQAQHEAVLRAEIPPSPSGSLPAPLSTRPSSPGSELCLSHPGVAVILESGDTPLHPPSGRGDKRRRLAKPKRHVEYWHELLAYIDAAYRNKFMRHYPWSNLARKNLWNLARVYSTWEAMAMWDLYLASESWWARNTRWSVYGMIRDMGRLLDDSRFKQFSRDHEDHLVQRRFRTVAKLSGVSNSVFSPRCSRSGTAKFSSESSVRDVHAPTETRLVT